jgi:hypothetical protein
MSEQTLDEFISARIRTVEEVEILNLLSRSPETFWSGDAVGQQLNLKPDVAAARCRDLVRQNLVVAAEANSAFRYQPADDAARKQVTALLNAYRDHRISVINSIYSANLTRLRSFADAFKLGGGRE